MTTTARNYAAQAERGLLDFSEKLRESGYAADVEYVTHVRTVIKHAVKFALPMNGRVLDDKLRGLHGSKLRLPFPCIVVEYPVDWEGYDKGVVVACETVAGNINTFSVLWNTVYKQWHLMLVGLNFESDGCIVSDGKDEVRARLAPVDVLKTMAAKYKKEYPDAYENAVHNAKSSSRAVFELLEALSCSNVTHEPIEKINPAVNARRIRDGKLPLYETRCLVINAGKQGAQGAQGAAQGGTHTSPRQHLRRGHIRRLDTGNIWVNSCVVSANSPLGKIEKSYAVAA